MFTKLADYSINWAAREGLLLSPIYNKGSEAQRGSVMCDVHIARKSYQVVKAVFKHEGMY